MEVKVYNVSQNELPKYETDLAAGLDVRADFSRISETNLLKVYGDTEFLFETDNHKAMLRLEPGSRVLIPTGLYVSIPEGYEIMVRPRSGLALKSGITVLNTPGCVDADYRGEIGVILINNGLTSFWIEDQERIAQLILNKVERVDWVEVNSKKELGSTARGDGGFGHTNNK